jgi:hypothetical protein
MTAVRGRVVMRRIGRTAWSRDQRFEGATEAPLDDVAAHSSRAAGRFVELSRLRGGARRPGTRWFASSRRLGRGVDPLTS